MLLQETANQCRNTLHVHCSILKLHGKEHPVSGLKKLNSSLPFGQEALKFCCPGQVLVYFVKSSWQKTCLGPWLLGK